MGNNQSSESTGSTNSPFDSKLTINTKVNNEEGQSLKEVFHQRTKLKNQHILTLANYSFGGAEEMNMFCESYNTLKLEYQPFDKYLYELKSNYPLPQWQVQRIVYGVCSALVFLEGFKYHHGDISTIMICQAKNQWKLIDNFFIKGGITAYEKVLIGDQAFISPYQMQKIRHGFIRQSPQISEADDIFSLGMTCLEVMTGLKSRNCYKESYIRFNEVQIEQRVSKIRLKYAPQFCRLVQGMINFNEQKRITIKRIMSNYMISRHSGKYSLKRGEVFQK